MAMSGGQKSADSQHRGGGGRLPAEVRRARIMASIEKTGFVSISGLAEELGVSGMTIRRDVNLLEGHGMFQRTHGGAVAEGHMPRIPSDEDEPKFQLRMRRYAAEKAAIDKTAASLVER